MIEVALRTVLLAGPPVAVLVGTRIYPVVLPEAPVYPAITYQIITGSSEYAMQGPSQLASPRFQIDLYAATSMALFTLKAALMETLSGFRGIVGSPPVHIRGAFREMELDAYEQELERAGPKVWRKTLDFRVWHKE
jgi:hypothetical protein